MEITTYREEDAAKWDELVLRSPVSTFLHSRRYLSYHGDRFKDVSALIQHDDGRLWAVVPAAIYPTNTSDVVSHPGITYGGIIHDGTLLGSRMIEALEKLTSHYRQLGFATFVYKVVPSIYHLAPAADDVYALFRLGASRYRCDLSCTTDLQHRLNVSSRRSRSLKKARKAQVEVVEGAEHIDALWPVVEGNLMRKYSRRPVHSAEEIKKLHSLFPNEIQFVVGRLNAEVVAGIVLFLTPRVAHAQYIAVTELGEETSALDAVVEHAIEKARGDGQRYFDFGTSTEQDGQFLNEGLYKFKSEFGAGGVVHEFYKIDLRQNA